MECLKIYSVIIGIIALISSISWIALQINFLIFADEIQEDTEKDKQIDLVFAILAIISSTFLLHGSIHESKLWLIAWTLGSFTILIGKWSCYFNYIFDKPENPDDERNFELYGLIVTFAFFILNAPVLLFMRKVDDFQWWKIPSKSWSSNKNLQVDITRDMFLSCPFHSFDSLELWPNIKSQSKSEKKSGISKYRVIPHCSIILCLDFEGLLWSFKWKCRKGCQKMAHYRKWDLCTHCATTWLSFSVPPSISIFSFQMLFKSHLDKIYGW